MKAQFYSTIFTLVLHFLFQGFTTSPALSQNIEWIRQYPLASARAISVDASGVYVTGRLFYTLVDPERVTDAFISKHDADGNELWTRQVGSITGEFP